MRDEKGMLQQKHSGIVFKYVREQNSHIRSKFISILGCMVKPWQKPFGSIVVAQHSIAIVRVRACLGARRLGFSC